MANAKTWEELGAEAAAKRRAPDGQIWQCRACNKQAEDKYGLIGFRSRGWDESCMLSCLLVPL